MLILGLSDLEMKTLRKKIAKAYLRAAKGSGYTTVKLYGDELNYILVSIEMQENSTTKGVYHGTL